MEKTAALLLCVSFLWGCEQKVCAPGATQTCVCPSGGQGAQACAADGSRWEACACAAGENAAGAPTGTSKGSTGKSGSAQSDSDATKQPAGEAGPAKRSGAAEPVGPQPYTITIVSAVVPASKPDGKAWDVGDGPPDPVATLDVVGAGSGTVRTSKLENTNSPAWNQSGPVTINRGDKLQITLIDKDALENDQIATWSIEFLEPGRKQLTHASGSSIVVQIAPRND